MIQVARSLRVLALASLALASASASAQTHPQVIPLWDGVAPGSESWTQKEGYLELSDTRMTPPLQSKACRSITGSTRFTRGSRNKDSCPSRSKPRAG